MEYTRGDWKVSGSFVYAEGNRVICKMTDDTALPAKELRIGSSNWDEMMVDAHLISASPDLYEALKEIMERFNGGIRFPLQSSCDNANKALAKAEEH